MLEDIISILKENKQISGWKINEKLTESVELFFIKKSLDMDRAKSVSHLSITIYVDFEEDGTLYRGSSSSEIHPTMTKEEIIKTVDRLAFAASLVKSKYYPLATPSKVKPVLTSSNLASKPLNEWIPDITKAIFSADVYDKGGINSAELFLNKVSYRIFNSEGINVNFSGFNGTLEFITNWKESSEEIELYRNLDFSSFDPECIKEEVENMLRECRDKSIAKPTPAIKDIPVLLTGETVRELFTYYNNQSNASAVYNKISTMKVGDSVQGDNVLGDKITLVLDPTLDNSTYSAPFDEDGFPLAKAEIFKDGVLERYWGNVRYSHYQNIVPTGNIRNFVVSGGSKSAAELKKKPYLELIAFSDFQMDSFTGNFAGEIRLGYYYDGNTTIPVTGGSLSGNIKKVHNNMYLSKELQQENNFVGPVTIMLNGVSIAGCE